MCKVRVLQSDYLSWATWKRVNLLEPEVYLRTKDDNLFLKQAIKDRDLDQTEKPKKCDVVQTSQEAFPFVDWLVLILNFV